MNRITRTVQAISSGWNLGGIGPFTPHPKFNPTTEINRLTGLVSMTKLKKRNGSQFRPTAGNIRRMRHATLRASLARTCGSCVALPSRHSSFSLMTCIQQWRKCSKFFTLPETKYSFRNLNLMNIKTYCSATGETFKVLVSILILGLSAGYRCARD